MHQVVILPPRGTWTGWRAELIGLSWSSTRRSTEFCTCGRMTWDTRTCWEPPKRKVNLQKWIWASWWTSNWMWTTNVNLLENKNENKTKQVKPNKNLNHPGAALSEILAADWGRCSFLSVQHCWDHTGRIVSSSGFCSTRDTRSFWKESNTGPWRWWRDCNIYPYNEGLRELGL